LSALDIRKYVSLNRSGLTRFVAQAYAELAAAGMTDEHEWAPLGSCRALFAFKHGEPIGCLLFFLRERNDFWIQLGYVVPQERRTGVYSELWKRLVVIAEAEQVAEIRGAASIKNEGIQRFNERIGRELVAFTYRFTIGAT
jgi:GNAT superfamily N-acetyltransferase